MILDDIFDRRRIQLKSEKSAVSLEEMKKLAKYEVHERASFKKALEKDGLSVIAEVKKASPSKGLIQPDFDPAKIASAYEQAGAAAISCLTEEHYFQGASKYLAEIRKAVKLPVLRKDFIYDEYQVYEAKAIGADALLLIAAMLDDGKFKELYELAYSLGLDVLCEAHSEEEVNRLIDLDCEIIGINNRDLKTFEVSLETTQRLAGLIPEGRVIVCESGIKDNADMRFADSCGADAVLVGETLMRSGLSGIPQCMAALKEGL